MLSSRDALGVLEIVVQLHAPCTLDEFAPRVMRLLPQLVASERTAYNEVNLGPGRIVALMEPNQPSADEVAAWLGPYLTSHPLIAYLARTAACTPVAISDFWPSRIYHQSAILGLTDCTLSNNKADAQGGAIYAIGPTGDSDMSLLRCTFSNNQVSQGTGGAIFSRNQDNGTADLGLTRCVLQNNNASTGGAIFNGGDNARLTECTLSKNSAVGGGAITNDAFSTSSTLRIIRSTLSDNSALNDGGAIQNRNDNGRETASLVVSNSTFSGNAVGGSGGEGGAIFNAAYFGLAEVEITDSTFAGNSAAQGASINNYGTTATRKATVTLQNSLFSAAPLPAPAPFLPPTFITKARRATPTRRALISTPLATTCAMIRTTS